MSTRYFKMKLPALLMFTIFHDCGGSPQTGKRVENQPDPPDGLAREGSITPHCQIPGTKMPSRLLPGARRAGILASWQLGMGIVAFQEDKMCTEAPRISTQNIDFEVKFANLSATIGQSGCCIRNVILIQISLKFTIYWK